MHEEIRYGTLTALHEWAQKGLKGEIVIVLQPIEEQKTEVESQKSTQPCKSVLVPDCRPAMLQLPWQPFWSSKNARYINAVWSFKGMSLRRSAPDC